jgi:hypothetical protein
MSDAGGGRTARLARAWQALALLVLNALVLLLLLNVALAWWFPAPPAGDFHVTDAIRARFNADFLRLGHDAKYRPFYPRWPREEIAELNTETFEALQLVYEPFAQFRHAALATRYVNLDPHGFRRGGDQGPWPPDPRNLNVFFFGGSTTLGVLLPDAATVPSQLQALLPRALGAGRPIRVYNFGRGYYFSSQERALFESLLVAGRRPDVAVFLDGLNDFYFGQTGEPALTPALQTCVAAPDAARPPLARALLATPLGRAATALGARLRRTPPAPPVRALPFADETGSVAERVIRRYAANATAMDAVGAANGVRVVRVWQPVPTYGYDLRFHRFAAEGFGRNAVTVDGYPAVARARAEGRLGPPGLVWCADIQRALHEPLYVDTIHYAPRMARRVAACIAKAMRRRAHA